MTPIKIELEYTPEELKTLLDGLNNSLIAVNKIYLALLLGVDVPAEFTLMSNMDYSFLKQELPKREKALKKLYFTLIKYEN